ncbi:MAG: proline--tRNA ligase [Candidatus Bipolaricaulota bacterium]
MKFSEYFLPTLKETPADAKLASHKLMLKAGMIRKVTAGVYDYLPMGFKVLKKVEEVVREEMNRAGCQEVKLPIIQPADLWRESGRWGDYGDEMFKLSDRKDQEFALGPTHEEIITDMVRNELSSYKDLPLTLYQINDKYRDEIRPRHGVMRSREFLMKDAYSFHSSQESLEETYQDLYDAYARVFDRLGLDWYAVDAPSGLMGGSYSQEFIAVADEGGEEIAVCHECGYASNVDIASYQPTEDEKDVRLEELEEVETPGKDTVAAVADYLDVPEGKIVKTFIYSIGDGYIAALVGGDDELEETKLSGHLGRSDLEMVSTESEIETVTGANFGSIGPIGLDIPIYADEDIKTMKNFIVGANRNGYHLNNINWERDLKEAEFIDLRRVREGDKCPKCGGDLDFYRGIEVGQIFQLGEKYSNSLDANYQDEDGQLKPYLMGCYGIGISRVIPAIIQQNYDEDGINWTETVQPFDVGIIVLEDEGTEGYEYGSYLYDKLRDRGYDPLFDERDDSPGVKFNDANLIGLPVMVIIGPRGMENGELEVEYRSGGKDKVEIAGVPREDVVDRIEELLGS